MTDDSYKPLSIEEIRRRVQLDTRAVKCPCGLCASDRMAYKMLLKAYEATEPGGYFERELDEVKSYIRREVFGDE